MGAITVGWEDGQPLYADNPRAGNRACRRSKSGISRGETQ